MQIRRHVITYTATQAKVKAYCIMTMPASSALAAVNTSNDKSCMALLGQDVSLDLQVRTYSWS